jgi:hypothetical protein
MPLNMLPRLQSLYLLSQLELTMPSDPITRHLKVRPAYNRKGHLVRGIVP